MSAHAVPSTPLDVDTALQEGSLGNLFPFLGTLKVLAGIRLPRQVIFSTRQWGRGEEMMEDWKGVKESGEEQEVLRYEPLAGSAQLNRKKQIFIGYKFWHIQAVSTFFYSLRCRCSTPRRCTREQIPVPWCLKGTCWPGTAKASPFFDVPVGHRNSGRKGGQGGTVPLLQTALDIRCCLFAVFCSLFSVRCFLFAVV